MKYKSIILFFFGVLYNIEDIIKEFIIIMCVWVKRNKFNIGIKVKEKKVKLYIIIL